MLCHDLRQDLTSYDVQYRSVRLYEYSMSTTTCIVLAGLVLFSFLQLQDWTFLGLIVAPVLVFPRLKMHWL